MVGKKYQYKYTFWLEEGEDELYLQLRSRGKRSYKKQSLEWPADIPHIKIPIEVGSGGAGGGRYFELKLERAKTIFDNGYDFEVRDEKRRIMEDLERQIQEELDKQYRSIRGKDKDESGKKDKTIESEEGIERRQGGISPLLKERKSSQEEE